MPTLFSQRLKADRSYMETQTREPTNLFSNSISNQTKEGFLLVFLMGDFQVGFAQSAPVAVEVSSRLQSQTAFLFLTAITGLAQWLALLLLVLTKCQKPKIPAVLTIVGVRQMLKLSNGATQKLDLVKSGSVWEKLHF